MFKDMFMRQCQEARKAQRRWKNRLRNIIHSRDCISQMVYMKESRREKYMIGRQIS